MMFRTDLAVECRELAGKSLPAGVSYHEEIREDIKTISMHIQDDQGSHALGKPKGHYITVETPPFSEAGEDIDARLTAVSQALSSLLPKDGCILVVGLGNSAITPDALGPRTASRILATRHLKGEFVRAAGLDGLRSVAVLSPGVLGQTGMETGELLAGIVQHIHPSAVIAVDALASRSLDRLGCTVQLSDTGITPGAGVGNRRALINQESLGVPVIAMGVPTVVDALTLAADLTHPMPDDEPTIRKKIEPQGRGMVVTPKEIDLLIDRAAFLLSLSNNAALQPTLSPQDLLSLVS